MSVQHSRGGKHQKAQKRNLPAAFCGAVGTVLVLAVILLLLPLAIPRLLGYEVYSIASGSMEPAIPKGSMVLVNRVLPDDVQTGDIIAYDSEGVVITHRVTEICSDTREFITKGDANEREDFSPVPFSDLLGEVTFYVPILGDVAAQLVTLRGKLSLLALLLSGLLFRLLAGRLCDSGDGKGRS